MKKKRIHQTHERRTAYRCHQGQLPTPEEKFAEVLQALRGMLQYCDTQPANYAVMVANEHIRIARMMDDYARSIGAEPKYWKILGELLFQEQPPTTMPPLPSYAHVSTDKYPLVLSAEQVQQVQAFMDQEQEVLFASLLQDMKKNRFRS